MTDSVSPFEQQHHQARAVASAPAIVSQEDSSEIHPAVQAALATARRLQAPLEEKPSKPPVAPSAPVVVSASSYKSTGLQDMPYLVHAVMRRTTPLLHNVKQRLHSVREGLSTLHEQQQTSRGKRHSHLESPAHIDVATNHPRTELNIEDRAVISHATQQANDALQHSLATQQQNTEIVQSISQVTCDLTRLSHDFGRSEQDCRRLSQELEHSRQETQRISIQLVEAKEAVSLLRRELQHVSQIVATATPVQRANTIEMENQFKTLQMEIASVRQILEVLKKETTANHHQHDILIEQCRQHVSTHESTTIDQMRLCETSVQSIQRAQHQLQEELLAKYEATLSSLYQYQQHAREQRQHEQENQQVMSIKQSERWSTEHQVLQAEVQQLRESVLLLITSASRATVSVSNLEPSLQRNDVDAVSCSAPPIMTITSPQQVPLPIEDTNAAAQIEAMLYEPLNSPIVAIGSDVGESSQSHEFDQNNRPNHDVSSVLDAVEGGGNSLIEEEEERIATISLDCPESQEHIRRNVSKKVPWTTVALPPALTQIRQGEATTYIVRVSASKHLSNEGAIVTRLGGKRRPTSLSNSVLGVSLTESSLLPCNEDSLLVDGASILDESILPSGMRGVPFDQLERAAMADRAERSSEQQVHIQVDYHGHVSFVLDQVNEAQGAWLDDGGRRVSLPESSYELRVAVEPSAGAPQQPQQQQPQQQRFALFIRRNIRRMPTDRLHPGSWQWMIVVRRCLSAE